MKSITLVSGVALLAAGFVSAQGADQPPCGANMGRCPQGNRCVPSDPKCIDLTRCAGKCEPLNRLQRCGGFSTMPQQCPGMGQCIDDPRFPNSCGMKCDVPGICVTNEMPRCGGYRGPNCPNGLQCFDMLNDECDPGKGGGTSCEGICL